jgi:hypothetical protein
MSPSFDSFVHLKIKVSHDFVPLSILAQVFQDSENVA